MFLSRVILKPDIGNHSQLGSLLRKRSYGPHQLLHDLFDDNRRDFLYREEIAREQMPHPGVKGEPLYYLLSHQPPRQETPLFQVQVKPFQPVFSVGQRLAFRLRANPVVMRHRQRHDLVMDQQSHFYRQWCDKLGLPSTGSKATLRHTLLNQPSHDKLIAGLGDYLETAGYLGILTEESTASQLLHLALQESVRRRLMAWLTDNPSRKGIFSLAQRARTTETSAVGATSTFEWHGYRAHPLPEKRQHARFFSVDMGGELIVQDPTRFLLLLQQGVGSAKAFGCGLMLVKPLKKP